MIKFAVLLLLLVIQVFGSKEDAPVQDQKEVEKFTNLVKDAAQTKDDSKKTGKFEKVLKVGMGLIGKGNLAAVDATVKMLKTVLHSSSTHAIGPIIDRSEQFYALNMAKSRTRGTICTGREEAINHLLQQMAEVEYAYQDQNDCRANEKIAEFNAKINLFMASIGRREMVNDVIMFHDGHGAIRAHQVYVTPPEQNRRCPSGESVSYFFLSSYSSFTVAPDLMVETHSKSNFLRSKSYMTVTELAPTLKLDHILNYMQIASALSAKADEGYNNAFLLNK